MENSIKDYLEQLVWEYSQICQRPDGSVYGIRSGLKCKKGSPISYNPNLAKLGGKQGLKQVKVSNKDRVKNIVAKAKAIGLSNKEIRQIKEEVKVELNAKKVQGKDALKLFAKKANQLAKDKKKNNQQVESKKVPQKSSRQDPVTYETDAKTGFLVPKTYQGYDIQKDLNDPNAINLGSGAMGSVFETKGPPPGILKVGKIGQHEAEVLGRLKGTGVAPEFHGASYDELPGTVGYGYGAHVKEARGNLAMSKMQGRTLANSTFKDEAEREATQRAYIQARKTIHTNGVAHNDMHSSNTYVKPDGSIGLIDFGLAQVGYKYALIEAMGAADGNDWQFARLVGGSWYNNSTFDKNSSTNQTLLRNIQAAKEYMRDQYNVTWGGMEIRSKESDVYFNPVNNMTDDQIKEVLGIIYTGF
jgi:hypothetical protein